MSAEPRQRTYARAAAPQPVAAVRPVAAMVSPRLQLRGEPRVSQRSDPAEREAEATAKQIMRMAAPAEMPAVIPGGPRAVHLARFADAATLIRQRTAGTPAIARAAAAPAAAAPPGFAGAVANSSGGGSPLPAGVRGVMEARFGADFSRVRVHTGETAARLSSQVSAQAFTYGRDVFFGRDRFRPDMFEGRELIAHELTHTIQQGGTTQDRRPVQRSEAPRVGERSAPEVQRFGVGDVLGFFARQANDIPGFRLLTIVIGVNPISMSPVDRSAANLVRAVVECVPGGGLIVRALDAYGIFERVGMWIERQLASLGITGASIRAALDRFVGSLGLGDLVSPGAAWDRARAILAEPIGRVMTFVRGLGTEIVRMIKDAVLRPLAAFAAQTRGWDLLCAVLGKNPITGEAVRRTAETLIGGFMRLIGQEEIWHNIQRANAIGRAWAWFQTALSGLMGFVRQIPQLLLQAIQALEFADLVLLPRAFARVAGVFGSLITDFLSWAGNAVWNLLEIIFEVLAPKMMIYLRRAAAAFHTILRDPISFGRNLLRAATLGFGQFAGNFLTHLRASLIGWLTGAMSGANIYIPQGFELREIIKFVLSVLGLTWQSIRQKLVRAIGETAVRVLETGFDLVMTLVTQGPAAAWQKIQEGVSNLRQMVLEQIMMFVRDRVVTAAVTRLLSMLSPAGAFIQAIMAIYNTVMFFVERLHQIAQVAASFIDSISAIAGGVIGAAANRVETTMAGLLTLVISFLARIAGLGRVTDAVTSVIDRVRQPIDRALDRVVEWIVEQGRRLGRLAIQAGVPQDPAERVRRAGRAAAAIARRLSGRVTRSLLGRALAVLRVRYGLTKIEPYEQDATWWVYSKINAEDRSSLEVPAKPPRTAAGAIDLGSSKSGATFYQLGGRYYSVPAGEELKVPPTDVRGDAMQWQVQQIADSFQPMGGGLTPKQISAIRQALPGERGNLMVMYKGTWVHEQMEEKFNKKKFKLKWSRRGIDARGARMSYEVLTWTEYGVTSHLGRKGGMDLKIWRAIYYYETSDSIASYIKAVTK